MHVIKGDYRDVDLPCMLKAISDYERDELVRVQDKDSFERLYNRIYRQRNIQDIDYAWYRLNRANIIAEIQKYVLLTDYPEWLWPKGKPEPRTRLSIQGRGQGPGSEERPLDCALREFREETLVVLPKKFILSEIPVVESVTRNEGRVYETKHWVIFLDELPVIRENKDPMSEIAEVRWVTTEEARNLLSDSKLYALEIAVCHLKEYIALNSETQSIPGSTEGGATTEGD